MENRPYQVVLTTDRKLGETHNNSMSPLTFDPRVKVKGKILGILSFIQGDITWSRDGVMSEHGQEIQYSERTWEDEMVY